jgi:hypothetical protein
MRRSNTTLFILAAFLCLMAIGLSGPLAYLVEAQKVRHVTPAAKSVELIVEDETGLTPRTKWRCPYGHVSNYVAIRIAEVDGRISDHCVICYGRIIRALVPEVVEVKEEK